MNITPLPPAEKIDTKNEHDSIVEAFEMIDAGRKEEAQLSLRRLAVAGTVRPEVHHTIGLLFEDAGDASAAANALAVASTLDFSGTGALRDLVRVYVAMNEYGKAIGCLSLILKKEGPSPELLDVVQSLLAEMPASATSIDWLSPEIESLRRAPIFAAPPLPWQAQPMPSIPHAMKSSPVE